MATLSRPYLMLADNDNIISIVIFLSHNLSARQCATPKLLMWLTIHLIPQQCTTDIMLCYQPSLRCTTNISVVSMWLMDQANVANHSVYHWVYPMVQSLFLEPRVHQDHRQKQSAAEATLHGVLLQLKTLEDLICHLRTSTRDKYTYKQIHENKWINK